MITTTESTEDFSALIVRVRSGDEAAMAELAGRYEADVRLAARVLLGPLLRPHLDSMDLVQSIHRRLLAGLREHKFDLDHPDQLRNLVLMMVRRKVARHGRRQERRRRLEAEAASSGARRGVPSAPDDPARRIQLGDEVNHVLARLDATERLVVELRLLGYSTAEAARALGLDADVLRVRLSRMRRRLAPLSRALAEAL